MPLDRVAKRTVHRDPIVVAPPLALGLQIAGLLEIGDDTLDGTFGDADAGGKITHQDRRRLNDAQKNVSMVGEKSPLRSRSSG